jgi:peptidoglycan/LPS O-acetylase OafA/YrhL
MYYIYLNNYKVKEDKKITFWVWGLSIVRIVLCLFPQNNWLANNSPLLWGVIRNIPFAILGALIVVLYFKVRNKDKALRFVYLFVTFSFLFYIPVVLWSETIELLGMLMLPKTVCYVLVILAFKKKLKA